MQLCGPCLRHKMTFQYFEIIKIHVSKTYYQDHKDVQKGLDRKIDFQNTFLHTKCTNNIYGSIGPTIILEV